MKLFVALSIAMLLVAGAWCAPATKQTQQSSRSTLDFIAHEQALGAAQAAQAVTPGPTTRSPSRLPSGDTQQHLHQHQQRVNASSMPKKDWELVPPHQASLPTPRPTPSRPTPPSYAGVVKDQRQGQAGSFGQDRTTTPRVYHGQDRLTTLRVYVGQDRATTPRVYVGQDRATTPRVYNIPISVEPGYTTSTEASRWYDKLFGKSVDTDADDSPWGRRRRQAEQRGEQHPEIVIGSNAIHVAARPPPAKKQAPRQSSSA